MGRLRPTTSVRVRQMRRVLARWQRSGLTLRAFGQQRGHPAEHSDVVAAGHPACRRGGGERRSSGERGGVQRSVTAGERSEKTIGSGDRPAQRACGAGTGGSRYPHAAAGTPGPADDMLTLPTSVRVFVARGATDLRRSFDRLSVQVQEVLRQDPFVRPRVCVLQPPTQSREVAGVGARRVLAAVQAPGGRDLRESRRYTRLPIGG